LPQKSKDYWKIPQISLFSPFEKGEYRPARLGRGDFRKRLIFSATISKKLTKAPEGAIIIDTSTLTYQTYNKTEATVQ